MPTVWQKICEDWQNSQWWHYLFGRIVSDMEIAIIFIPVLIIAFIAFYENAKKTAHLPRAPFGLDAEYGPDSARVRDELETLTRR